MVIVIIFLSSFCLIVYGGNKFVDSSMVIAKKLKIPSPIIGATLVTIGTTMPELLVTIISSGANANGIAIGNAVGSIIINTCIIGGVLIAFTRVKINRSSELLLKLLLLCIVVLSVISINSKINYFEALILLSLFFVFIVINRKQSKASYTDYNITGNNSLFQAIVMFILSSLMLTFGAYYLVDCAKFFARWANVSETIIGLTVVSLGTSLPELVTSILAIKKKEPSLGLGNVVGSNIINSTLLVGITGINCTSAGVALSATTSNLAIPFALISTIVFSAPALLKKHTKRVYGILLMLIFATYFILLNLSTFNIIKIIQ